MFITDNCSDYKVISRYLTPPHLDIVAGKQSLKKKNMFQPVTISLYGVVVMQSVEYVILR